MQTETTVAVGGEATVAISPEPQTTQAMTPVQCPICAQMNPPGEVYCIECGFLLSSAAPTETAPAGAYPKLRDGAGREFLLKAGENIVGRDPSSDVLISDGTVSRRHACILIEENRAYLQDLGSTNGTFLGETKITPNMPTTVPPDATLTLGKTQFRIEWATAAEPTEASEAPTTEADAETQTHDATTDEA